jgi:membrane fusion protein
MITLFRKEAVEANSTAHLGGVLLKPPLSHTLSSIVAMALAATLISFLFFSEYTKRTRVTGLITPNSGVTRVFPSQPGIVTRQFVTEGDVVAAGQPLVELTMERMVSIDDGITSANVKAIEQLVAQKQSLKSEKDRRQQLFEAQRIALHRRTEHVASELLQIDRELATQRHRLESSRAQLARAERLADQGFLSDVAVQQKRDELLDQRGRLQALERTNLALKKEESGLASEIIQLPLLSRREVDEIERAIAGAERELALAHAQRRNVVIAPTAGRVTAISAQVGQAANSAPLLTILPESKPLLAHLYAPGSAVGFVAPDQRVLIRFAAFPYQKFGQYEGKVLHVSRTALVPSEIPPQLSTLIQQAGVDGLYLITVALSLNTVDVYGKPAALAPGMQLEADIMQDRRRLIEWLFEPLIGFKSRL